MKRYTAAKARAQLSSLLDAAENGEVVAIERRGVRFTLRSEKPARRRKSKPRLEIVDPALLDGEWTWASGARGLRLRLKRAR